MAAARRTRRRRTCACPPRTPSGRSAALESIAEGEAEYTQRENPSQKVRRNILSAREPIAEGEAE
eukprot:4284200-Pyramimonas_sp.AAC.1